MVCSKCQTPPSQAGRGVKCPDGTFKLRFDWYINSDAKYFLVLHRNIRSLPKNLNLLEEILCSLDSKIDILGITETKLREKSISDVNIEGYNFYHTDSTTNAGGATLYITSNLNALIKIGPQCIHVWLTSPLPCNM